MYVLLYPIINCILLPKYTMPRTSRKNTKCRLNFAIQLVHGLSSEFQELIREIDVPAIFSDFCEEAAHLAARCITAVTGRPLTVPVWLVCLY